MLLLLGDVHTRINFYSPEDATDTYCLLQGCHIYEGCCEVNLHFASKFISAFNPYIPRYQLDYNPPRTPLISWQLPPLEIIKIRLGGP